MCRCVSSCEVYNHPKRHSGGIDLLGINRKSPFRSFTCCRSWSHSLSQCFLVFVCRSTLCFAIPFSRTPPQGKKFVLEIWSSRENCPFCHLFQALERRNTNCFWTLSDYGTYKHHYAFHNIPSGLGRPGQTEHSCLHAPARFRCFIVLRQFRLLYGKLLESSWFRLGLS